MPFGQTMISVAIMMSVQVSIGFVLVPLIGVCHSIGVCLLRGVLVVCWFGFFLCLFCFLLVDWLGLLLLLGFCFVW